MIAAFYSSLRNILTILTTAINRSVLRILRLLELNLADLTRQI